jgi:hypothetical protein
LELEILKQKITEAGIKVSMDKLKEFLDEKVILKSGSENTIQC